MEWTVFAIHFILNFVVFAFADCWPFRLAKAITHAPPSGEQAAGSIAVIGQPREQDGFLHTRPAGFGEQGRFHFLLSRADIGSLPDVPRTRRFECVPLA